MLQHNQLHTLTSDLEGQTGRSLSEMASSTASTSATPPSRGTDLTPLFQRLVVQSLDGGEAEVADRRRQWQRRRDDALGPILSKGFVSQRKALRDKRNIDNDAMATKDAKDEEESLNPRERDCLRLRRADEAWIQEAVRVHRAIVSLQDFLRGIRRPFLVSGPTSMSSRRQNIKASGESLEEWKQVTSLSDKERDEIDFQVRLTIKRCLARIKELEEGEAIRKRTTPGLSANPFSRLLGSMSGSAFPGRNHSLYADQLTQHRAAITQYIGNNLARANARFADMQEARLKAQKTKQINMAGSAAMTGRTGKSTEESRKLAAVPGSIRASGKAPDAAAKASSTETPEVFLDEKQPYQHDLTADELTPQKIEMFDRESSALVESLSDDLRAVEAAERKLTEISELQTQLIQHLGEQAEVADNLHQEALGHALEVGKGNEQLRKAKESNRQANRFLCIFLVGSGLGLLFLHWMD